MGAPNGLAAARRQRRREGLGDSCLPHSPADGTRLVGHCAVYSTDPDRIFRRDRGLAGAGGAVFCPDQQSGAVRWRNTLTGLAMRIVCLGGTDTAVQQAALHAQRDAAADATRQVRNALFVRRTEKRMSR